MARHPKQAEYDARSRFRRERDAQADLLGWTKLPVLTAYLTTDGDLVLFDNERNRYSTSAEAQQMVPVIEGSIVQPADVPVEEFGSRWNKGRLKIGNALMALDLTEADRADVLSKFESAAATLLRGVEVLRAANGPDWREQIGLES